MKYVIGIDIGTTNTKAVAFTTGGQVLASEGVGYSVFTDADGCHELDPDQLLEAVRVTLGRVEAAVGGAVVVGGGGPAGEVVTEGEAVVGGAVAAVCFSCAFHSLLAVDDQGDPLMRAMTWADLRPSAVAQALRGTDVGQRIYLRTGTPIHAMSPLCKLLWLRDNRPAIFSKAARFIGIKEYIWWRLTGKYQVDHSIASATGLFDIRRREWDVEALGVAGVDAGRLSMPVAGTHREGRWIIGAGDGCLANLGSGVVRPGETALTIGTSGAIRMTVSSPEDDPQGRLFNYILSDRLYASGGATNNGGNVLKWFFEKVLKIAEGDEDEWQRRVAEAAELPPGSEGLVFLPYLQGERAPVWDGGARGVWFGLRSIHDQRHFTRACLEGVSYCLYQIGSSLEETVGPIRHIVASGGFTRSAEWLRMIADIFNKPVHLTGGADASAIGAAIMGFQALGLTDDLEGAKELTHVTSTFLPDAERHAAYRQSYLVFSQLYDRLKDLM
jgi:gluconokinase